MTEQFVHLTIKKGNRDKSYNKLNRLTEDCKDKKK